MEVSPEPDIDNKAETITMAVPEEQLAESTTAIEEKPECNSTMKTKNLLDQHRKLKHLTKTRNYEDGRSHICQFCGKGFKTHAVMFHHEMRHNSGRDYKCPKWPECKSTFKTRDEANSHSKFIHVEGKRFVCTVCNLTLKTKKYLQAHVKLHDDVSPYVCKVCGKGYKTRNSLSLHEASHANLREFKCHASDCPKAFNTKGELHKHNLVAHTPPAEWKYQCEYCDRKYPQKCTLDRHVKTHTNERPFECHLCEFKTYTNRELKKHLSTHNGVKAFKCFRCSAGFRYKWTLEAHLWQKHQIDVGEKDFACSFCVKKYSNDVRLQNHMKTGHPNIVIIE